MRVERLRTVLVVAILVLVAACAGQGEEKSTGGPSVTGAFDWKRFDGQEITVLLNEHPWTDGVQPMIGEFEDLTGIKVNVQTFSEDLYFDKMEQALRSSTPVADVYFLPMDSTGYTQYAADLIAPLTPYIDNPSLTEADYDVADFPEGFISVVEYPPGESDTQIYGIPITFETYILFTNLDLVDQYLGGQAPTTMDELVADAQKITDEGNGEVFGAVMRGIRSDTIMDTLTGVVFNAWGSDETPLPYNIWFEGDWGTPRLDDPRIVEGLTDYAKLVAVGPPNALTLDWPDANTLFAQGKAAFYIDASLFAPSFEDASTSQIAGRVGYSVMPPTSQGQMTGHWMWGLGIPANSEHKEAAWYFVQWATSKENTAKIGASTWGAPRTSAYDDPAYTDALVPAYGDAVGQAMQTSRPTAVMQEGWKEGALVIVDAMQQIAQGKDPTQVMASANDQMSSLWG
jgi:multiple sugar transport system substrate-binding protein